MKIHAYRRENGKVGIRNKLLIISVDECCDGVARKIAAVSPEAVVLTNWYTCMLGGNEESFNQMIAVGQNPNVAAVLVLSMGCGSILPAQIAEPILAQGKPAETLCLQDCGGSRNAISLGTQKLLKLQKYASSLKREAVELSEIVVGVKCGGSDTSSGIASNPSVGAAVDLLIDQGASCIAGELFELQGCEEALHERAVSEKVRQKIDHLIAKEHDRWSVQGADVETMSIGNYLGGLTTIEEKSFGALHKTGSKPIQDVLEINHLHIEKISAAGFYLSETSMLCGASGVNFASLGANLILWTTSSAGFNNALVPVIRVSGNPDLINEDIDIDAGGIIAGTNGVNDIAEEIVKRVVEIANGAKTAVEDLADSTLTLAQKDRRVERLLCKAGCASL